jgi:deoxyribodipyrimidine photo-lyase
LGFHATNLLDLEIVPGARGAAHAFDDFKARMARYAEARDFPAVKGPSYLSVHLRFGTISIRQLAREAWHAWQGEAEFAGGKGAEVWLSELIWRDFYFHILFHNPHVVKRAFKAEFEGILWETGARADELFAAWCDGRTGYPLVDAAMRQLNQTGYMHNRLRMVTASFLTKDLGLDWRRGERYFAEHLNDFDLSANNGGWQWAASTGCDAQPYFRIFNPVTQSERFDPQGKFIRRYVPELGALSDRNIHAPWTAGPIDLQAAGVEIGESYPAPVVNHAVERERTLGRFKRAMSQNLLNE